MKITFILITAIGSILMAPIENTMETASQRIEEIYSENSNGIDIPNGRTPSTSEEPLLSTSKDVPTRTTGWQLKSFNNEDLMVDKDTDQIASTINSIQLRLTTMASTENENLPDGLVSIVHQESPTPSYEVPLADRIRLDKVVEIMTSSESKSACINKSDSREKRDTIWIDTAHAVGHIKVSEDYPELHQSNRHIISHDYPVPNIVRVTLREHI